METFISAMLDTTLTLSPWLVLGALVAGILHAYLPPGFVRKTMRGPKGVVTAVAIGAPLPLCSCGVIPTGLGLKEDGASDGATLSFMISTPQTGVDSILVSAAFFGWPFALFKLLSAILTGIAGGLVAEAVVAPSEQNAPKPLRSTTSPGLKAGFLHGVDVLRSIWGWIIFGIVVSAAITAWAPSEFMTVEGGWNALWAYRVLKRGAAGLRLS